jgi:glycosyltransferase involved in cell wall biosynthesis
MKIGVITAHFPPEASAGSARIGPFVESWAGQNGCDVHVYTHKNQTEEPCPYSDAANVFMHRAPVNTVANTRSLPVRLFSEVTLCLFLFSRVLTRDDDIHVVSSPPFLAAAMTLVLSMIKGIPYVADIRDLYPEQLFAYDVVERGGLFGRGLIRLERAIYDRALTITAATDGLCSYIRERTETDVLLARNGIDTDHFFRKKQPPEDDSRGGADAFVILFHGTLGRSQNVRLILRYARYIKQQEADDIILRIIGDGPKRDNLKEGIDAYNLHEVIDYIGYVDFQDIPEYIREADLGFSPRVDGVINDTSFPVKVYECLGCGVPVIITPVSEAGNFVEEYKVGFQHENGNVGSIHKSIICVKNDSQKYREYSDRAVEVAKEFDRHEIGNKVYEHIHHSLVASEVQ